MGAKTGTTRWGGQLRVLLGFAALSLVPIVVIGAVLNDRVYVSAQHQSLRATQAAATGSLRAGLQLSGFDPATFATAPIQRLRPQLDLLLRPILSASADHVQISVVSATGAVLYSSVPGWEGTTRTDAWSLSPTVGRAARVVPADRIGVGALFAGRVYQFVMPVSDEQTAAAIEVIGDAGGMLADAQADMQATRWRLYGALGVLWLSMLPIVWTMSRRMKRQVDDNRWLALHDPLTGLPNRSLLTTRVETAISEAAHDGSVVGLMLIDLDDFKDVNDTLGHQAGDALLQEVGRRLAGAVRDSDSVARLGGDEFAVVVAHAQHPSVIAGVADRLLAALDAPVQLGEVGITPGASIGIAQYPQHGTTMDVLLRRADIAMYAAKSEGLGRRTYSGEIDLHSASRLTLTSELRAALRSTDQITLSYQPIHDAVSHGIVQLEALVRWQHPTKGELSPAVFLGLAERTGLMSQLTDRTLALLLQQQRTLLDAGTSVKIALNLSTVVLRDLTLPDRIEAALRDADVPADLVEFEVTETSLLHDPDAVLPLLRRLRALGSSLALDDFGQGFSSLSHLRSLEADGIKIDKAFIDDLLTSSVDQTIVAAVINLGHELGMVVTAEGVEHADQAARLAALGCDRLQGFHFARPRPAHEIVTLLSGRQVPG